MPRHFTFLPDTYETPTVGTLRVQWANIPDRDALNVIAVELQYLHFHTFLLTSIRHSANPGDAAIPLGLSLRAGALKSANLVCASIAEAALRAHAERRRYPLHKDPQRRTFGNVLGAWQDPATGQPLGEVVPIWPQLQLLRSGRNNIHLYKVVEEGGDFYDLLEAESRALSDNERLLETIRGIVSA